MRKEIFTENEYYHIYNRGVDKRLIFMDNRDRFRFTNSLYLLNSFQDIPLNFDVVSLHPKEILVPQPQLVEISAACLMPNHYHFLTRPLQDAGISKFLQKLGVSYTKYFNKRHERSGALFESTFKAKHIDRDEYARYLTKYIHFNPYSLFQTRSGIDVIDSLITYPWSTFADYMGGKSNFSHIVSMNFRDKILDMNVDQYKRFCLDFIDEEKPN